MGKIKNLYIIEIIDKSILRDGIINSILGYEDLKRHIKYFPSRKNVKCYSIIDAKVLRSLRIAEKYLSFKERERMGISLSEELVVRKMSPVEVKEWVEYKLERNNFLRKKTILRYNKILGNLRKYVNWE